jgi:hypothetical protein
MRPGAVWRKGTAENHPFGRCTQNYSGLRLVLLFLKVLLCYLFSLLDSVAPRSSYSQDDRLGEYRDCRSQHVLNVSQLSGT